MAGENKGKVTQVVGAVLDIRFDEGKLPSINEAIRIPTMDGGELTVEVSQHLGDDTVRCIAMGSTDGLKRGMEAIATGAPISVPVGEKTLGRIFNVLGQPIDNKPAPEGVSYEPIHRPAPEFEEQSTDTELLETGIKVVDLLCPYQKGGKIGLGINSLCARYVCRKGDSYGNSNYLYCNYSDLYFWCEKLCGQAGKRLLRRRERRSKKGKAGGQ